MIKNKSEAGCEPKWGRSRCAIQTRVSKVSLSYKKKQSNINVSSIYILALDFSNGPRIKSGLIPQPVFRK